MPLIIPVQQSSLRHPSLPALGTVTDEAFGGTVGARCRSEPLWEGIQTLVDMHTPLSALEDVAYQVVASMKLHPKLFGGDYRVWFENTTAGFKKELAVWFNHSSSGTAAPQQATLLPELPAICCVPYWRQELKQLGRNCWVLEVYLLCI